MKEYHRERFRERDICFKATRERRSQNKEAFERDMKKNLSQSTKVLQRQAYVKVVLRRRHDISKCEVY